MAESKTSSKKRKTPQKSTNKKKNSRKNTANRQPERQSKDLSREISVLAALAVSIVLALSNFGLGGKVGAFFSRITFGLMGWIAYIFPFLLFFTVAFVIVNRNNSLLHLKMTGLCLGFIFLSTLIHLLTMGYAPGDTITSFFTYSADYKTGGGVLGGEIAKLLYVAFGSIGAYVIVVIGFLISGIIMTQRSFMKPIKHTGERVYKEARETHLRKKQERTFAYEQLKLQEDTIQPKSVKPEKQKKQKVATVKEEAIRETAEVPLAFPEIRIQRPDPEELFPASSPYEEDFNMTPIHAEQEKEENITLDQKNPVGKRNNPRSSDAEVAEGIQSIKTEIAESKPDKTYVFPPIDLLKKGEKKKNGDSDQYLRETAAKLQTTLHNFGVNVTVTDVSCGPTVTRYELQPEQGVKVSRIVSLADDIKLNLAAADIRIEAPIPGKAAVGIEVPNATNSAVLLRDLLESKEFKEFPSELAFALGKDIAGKTVVADIGRMPHVLIAGATGSGKSVCINTLIMSIIYKATPDQVKLIMIDPKVVELSVYNGIPHLYIPVVTDPKKAAGALNWAVSEMTDRYNKFAEYGVRDLAGYNAKVEQIADIEDENKPTKLPKIVIIVDELADLMMVAPGEVEDAICRLAQLARAAGIHLIIATQRPSVNVITGLIKANMPSRIAFSVSSGVDSRTILDMNGAEKLLGKGDMLYSPQEYQKPVRLQGSFVSDKEVSSVVEFLTKNSANETKYNEKITEMMNSSTTSVSTDAASSDKDAYFADAARFIIEKDKASIGMLQRMFKIGFNRAARIMDQLCEAGVVGPEEGTKPRKVLMSMEEFENYVEECL